MHITGHHSFPCTCIYMYIHIILLYTHSMENTQLMQNVQIAYHSSSGVKYFVNDAELVVRGAMEGGSVEVDHIT